MCVCVRVVLFIEWQPLYSMAMTTHKSCAQNGSNFRLKIAQMHT